MAVILLQADEARLEYRSRVTIAQRLTYVRLQGHSRSYALAGEPCDASTVECGEHTGPRTA